MIEYMQNVNLQKYLISKGIRNEFVCLKYIFLTDLSKYRIYCTKKEINDTLDKMSPLEMLIYWFIHADEKDDTFDYVKK